MELAFAGSRMKIRTPKIKTFEHTSLGYLRFLEKQVQTFFLERLASWLSFISDQFYLVVVFVLIQYHVLICCKTQYLYNL
jgi:hypothetical protein